MRLRLSDRRVFQLNYAHNGLPLAAEVGQRDVDGEVVLAIFQCDNAFVVCTPSRGGAVGSPILVGKADVRTVEDFRVA